MACSVDSFEGPMVEWGWVDECRLVEGERLVGWQARKGDYKLAEVKRPCKRADV